MLMFILKYSTLACLLTTTQSFAAKDVESNRSFGVF